MNIYPHDHHRKSIRLKGYDYAQEGLYFITICCHDQVNLFGEIKDGVMILNDLGQIAFNQWGNLSDRFTNLELDVFQIMPNHIHGIISLNAPVGATLAVALNDSGSHDEKRAGASPAPTRTVGNVIGTYKSLVANKCLAQFKLNRPNDLMGKLWQRNYYEHIIRDEQSLQTISNYIIENPANWSSDIF